MGGPFNIEQAVATWRRFLPESRSLSSEAADELESHLRDEIDELLREGFSPADAFEAAMRRLGDGAMLDEVYRDVYWKRVVRERRLTDEITWSASMLKNYLLTALRNVRRQKGYAFINVAGLSIGLACSFFILLWVMHELSFDRFHRDGDRLYQVMRHGYLAENIYTWGSVPKPLADALEAGYPEVENAMLTTGAQAQLITYEDRTFRQEGHQVSPSFFDAFTFPFILGDPASALGNPESIVISENLAARLFGGDWQDQDLLGRILQVDHEKDFRITGVFEEVPENSTLQFDYVLSIEEYFPRNAWVENWGSAGLELYVRLKPGASHEEVNRKIANLIRDNQGFANAIPFLQPFEENYLYGEFENGVNTGGRIELIRIFGVVAVFLLLIASINFMNLATARSTQRSKEIGVRKALGATQGSLAGQFMAESMLLAGFAFLLALALVVALLPVFNTITGKHFGAADLSPAFLASILGVALVTGLLAGSYPALYLSSFNPVTILRGTFRQKPGEARLRKGLVVFQFALSTLIIVSTAAVYFQIQYIMEKDLGLDRGNVITFGFEGAVQGQYDTFRQELLQKPGIVDVSTSSENPLDVGNNTTDPAWDGKDPNDETLIHIISTHYDFVETMKMEMAAGRAHARSFGADSAGYLINEQMAKAMGMENPVGARLTVWGQEGTVIGVVKDFHMASFEAPIQATVIRLDPGNTDHVWVRAEPGKTQEALAGLEAVYKQFNPGYPFEYDFLDKAYEEQYRGVLVMGKLANVFAVIAVLISCLGLFGLASFTAEQRRKEIGIRKVLGASASRLAVSLSMDFTKLVVIAFVLAAPLAYLAVDSFLSSFEYRARMSMAVFAGAGLAAFLIACLTVGYQSFKAASADPVKSLRAE